MHSPSWKAALLVALVLPLTLAQNIRAIFLFKDVLKSNTTALTQSGFNSAIMFGVGVVANGSIMYYSNTPGTSDVMIASGGRYVGGAALQDKVRSLKGSGSKITRVEICMNSANIRELMNSPGPGADTDIYRNFAALKTAWNLDAVNNNDEALYHVASTVTFGRMVGAIGYKYSATPYTRVAFYQDVKKQLGAALMDRFYLQCYDGGANNDPLQWQTQLGAKVVPLLWVVNDSKPSNGQTPAQAKTKFAAWKAKGELGGAGYWNEFDIEKMKSSYTDYANVLNELFPGAATAAKVARNHLSRRSTWQGKARSVPRRMTA
ncbi:uncharacterized protein PpBr36_10752 [Pyricularia pennisetigena]|uniref:uncharacterized protein n=1 Tax=Pyricularia pennisetigena TaxID=1578925 RepID=UPI00114F9E2A|nr:uncharacterized protein PpBr36_10752 [Pyricularia pennisetigena]TLS20888.1 hypothetical protein PpBr36_10752 [Pyricularia pennisetigena]